VNSKPRLLYLIGQFPAINHGYLLAEIRHLRGLGFDIEVVSVSEPDRPMAELTEIEREEAGHTYYVKSLSAARIALLNVAELLGHPLHYLRGLFFAVGLAGPVPRNVLYHLAYFAEAVVVGRRMRDLGITHLHASFSATVALIAAKVFPVTWSFGVYGFGELHDPGATHLTERIASCRFVRSISRHGRGHLMLSCERSQWPKLLYSPLGIDPAEFTPRRDVQNHDIQNHDVESSSALRLLCVGRLSQEKGQALLLEAIASLSPQERKNNIQLHIVGDGPDGKWLRDYAVRLNLTTEVVFEGWIDRDRLMALYSKTDIFVLPSLAEGIPMVLMEAMALEVPCVAPHIAGIPELIEHGVDGLLFTVADVSDLAQSMRALLDSPELRQRTGKHAREKVLRDYDMARNTTRFAALLEEQLQALPKP
jgi:colanic acid/amylovoran biosynthesis glycosyltransferase